MNFHNSETQTEQPAVSEMQRTEDLVAERAALFQTTEGIHFLDLLVVTAKCKELIAKCTLWSAAAGVVISFLIPSIYTATTKLMPPQQSQSSSLIMGQLGPLANLAGIGQDLGMGSRDLYMGLLHSRTIADRLIQRFELMRVYRDKKLTDARKDLDERTLIAGGKEGIITISFEDKDPNRAAAIANAYVEELHKLTQRLAVSEASQRRLFFEVELQKTNEDLKNAEIELMKTQEQTGLIAVDEQAKVIMQSIAATQAQIAAKEVELRAMRTFGTGQNPDVIRTEEELSKMRSQRAGLENSHGGGNGDIYVPTGKIPSKGLEYIRKLRDVKYYETLFELMAKQFEAAKIDEAKNGAIIQVLDEAIVPEKRTRPIRSLVVMEAAVFGFFVSIFFVFFVELGAKANADPEQAVKLHRLRAHLSEGIGGKWMRSSVAWMRSKKSS